MKSGSNLRSILGIVIFAMVFSIGISAQSGGTSVRGIVKDSSYRVVRSVWVVLMQDGVEKGRSLTDDDGIYYINGLSEGTYDIAVLLGNREAKREQITLSGDMSHNITIPPKR